MISHVLTPFKSPVISQPYVWDIPREMVVGFNPVQKSGHIPTRVIGSSQTISKVLTPFKSPVISQLNSSAVKSSGQWVLTPFKSPVISQLNRASHFPPDSVCFNPVQKSGHIPTLLNGEQVDGSVSFNPVQKSGHIPTNSKGGGLRTAGVLTPFKSPVISQRL